MFSNDLRVVLHSTNKEGRTKNYRNIRLYSAVAF